MLFRSVAPRSLRQGQATSIPLPQAPSSIAARETREAKRREEDGENRWRASSPRSLTLTQSLPHSLTLSHSLSQAQARRQEEEERRESFFATHKNELSIHFLGLYTCPTSLGQSSPFYMAGHWPRPSFPISFLFALFLYHRPFTFANCTRGSLALFYNNFGCTFIFKSAPFYFLLPRSFRGCALDF